MNLFDYLENIYNSNEEYRENYGLEYFIESFIRQILNFSGSTDEGFADENNSELVCAFTPDIKLDFENKTIEILVQD